MKYPNITSLGIKNFRNIAKAEISFKESPIVCLTGENESGKSSFTIASAVLGVHAYQNKQTEYIRTGTQGFTILMNFDDGTALYRKKNASGNYYGIIKNGSIVWEINKIDPGGIPYEVQKIMGMIIEPETKEYMNIRTYRDLLLFIDTSSGTNYKVIYNALKVEMLYKSLRIGATEANGLQHKIAEEEQSVQTLQTQLRSIRLVDLEPAILIKERLTKEVNQLKTFKKAIELKEKIENLECVSKEILELYNLPEISESEITTLQMAYSNLVKVNNLINGSMAYKEVSKLETVDLQEITALRNAVNTLNKLENLRDSDVYSSIDNVNTISEVEVNLLESGLRMVNKIEDLKTKFEMCGREDLVLIDIGVDTNIRQGISLLELLYTRADELEKVNEKVRELESQIKNCGDVVVTTCSNCGETVIVPIQ